MLTRGYTLDKFVRDMDAMVESSAGQEMIFDRGASWLDYSTEAAIQPHWGIMSESSACNPQSP
jgi:hypothetical protein